MKKKLRKEISAAVAHLPILNDGKSWSKIFFEGGRWWRQLMTGWTCNHTRRAKRAYKKGGWKAVKQYIRKATPEKKRNSAAKPAEHPTRKVVPSTHGTATRSNGRFAMSADIQLSNGPFLNKAPKPTLLQKLITWFKNLFNL